MKPFLLTLLFLAPTVQYRVELGTFSFALLEPVVIVVSTFLLVSHWRQPESNIELLLTAWKNSLRPLAGPLPILFLAITLWAIIIRPWGLDWKHGLSDIRDWVIPVVGFMTLLITIRDKWGRWVLFYLGLVWISAGLGLYQYFADDFRPFAQRTVIYKQSLLSESDYKNITPLAIGFFNHPNSFAIYLFGGGMMGLGLAVQKKRLKWAAMLLAPIVPALFLTFAKTTLAVTLLVITLFWLQYLVPSDRILWGGYVAILTSAALAGVGLLYYLPATALENLWWRVELWQTAVEIIRRHPQILFTGNGLDIFAQQAAWGQPHNLYIYFLLEYGVIGVIWVLTLFGYLWRRGWQLRATGLFGQEPILAGVWLVLLAYAAIGLTESIFLGVESRMQFLLIAAIFIGLQRERQPA